MLIFKNKDKMNIFAWIGRIIKTIFYLFSNFYVLYYIVYGITAIVGTTYHPFLFSFHLFDILVRYPELSDIVRYLIN